jgi:hypothetical protein
VADILAESFCRVIFALPGITFVRIRIIFIQAILLNVIKCSVLITTATSLAAS